MESRQYDPAGRLAYVTDAMGRVTAYNYTDNGLVSQEVVAPSSTDWSQSFTVDAYTYDAAGNLTEDWTNNWETDTTYAVDAADRVTQQTTDPSGLDRTTRFAYTPDDQRPASPQRPRRRVPDHLLHL